MKKLLSIFFLLFLFNEVFAQYRAVKAFAEKEFDSKNYSQAAYYYEQLATGSYKKQKKVPFYLNKEASKEEVANEHPYISYQLGESYRLYQDYQKAKKWYDTVLNSSNSADFPIARLWYGICLRASGRFDDAITQLNRFKAEYKGDQEYSKMADREIAVCFFAKKQYMASLPLEIKKMDMPWNADGGNYALIKKGANYWFTSTRAGNGNSQNANHIYAVENSLVPVLLDLKQNEQVKGMQYSTPSVDTVHKRLYVTGWYKTNDQLISGIFYATWTGGKLSQLQKLNEIVNADGAITIQPFVTSDGKRLFFASDRPGGQGGFDLWASNLDAGGEPIDAVNLGKTVNTPEDDEAPYYDTKTGRLVFSSKGLMGLGGFDFFESRENTGKWTAPKNLGYPVNSPKDDLYYFADPDDNRRFFFSSDRESECCLDLFVGQYKPIVIGGVLTDCNSSKSLSGAKVRLVDSLSGETLAQSVTGPNGNYSLELPARKNYKVIFEKQGYFAKSIITALPVNQATLITEAPCLESYTVNKPIVIQNILYDFNSASLRSESLNALDGLVAIMKDNPAIKIELRSHTDSVGNDAYNLKLSQQRAESCVDYIISRGIDKDRVVAKGYGKTVPVAPNSLPNGRDNPAGRQLNRRTEFKVVGPKQ